MTATVYLYDDVARLREGAAVCFRLVAADFGRGKVALKVHFGEDGNLTHVKADWLKDAAAFFGEPVFVDCNVLYRGSRTVREDHLKVARKHGFGYLPIKILDGDLGADAITVPVNGGTIPQAKLGAGLAKFERLVSIAHFKGHVATGFGGALKNIGMGLGARAGKLEMHSIISPYVKSEACIACGTCVGDCPVDAIALDGKARIDPSKCIGCAHCIAVCPEAAIDVQWDLSGPVNLKLMERIACYASAALSGRRWWFMNFITDVTYDCDCLASEQTPFMGDVGILLSRDPVAIDKASLDLVKKRSKGVDPFLKKHRVDGSRILEYAEKMGLGVREYEIQNIR